MTNDNLKLFTTLFSINLMAVCFFGFASEALTYSGLDNGHILQLVSTHFSHHSWQHLLGNLMAIPLLLILFPANPSTLLLAFITCIFLIGVYATLSNVDTFLGFSALLYCIPGCYFVVALKLKNHIDALCIACILTIYLFLLPPNQKTLDMEWYPMTSAHMIGFLSGLMAQLTWYQYTKDDIKQS